MSALHYFRIAPVGQPVVGRRLACPRSGNIDAAFEHLHHATQEKDFDAEWAWRDPDLEWIRNDPRFREIVGVPPEEEKAGE